MNKKLKEIIDLQISGKVKEAQEAYPSIFNELTQEELQIAYINLANSYYEQKESSKALELYKKAAGLGKYNERVFFNIAMVYLQEKELEKSKENFLKAVALKESYVNAYINLAIVCKRLEQLDESCKYFEEALKYDDSNCEVFYNYANTLLRKEEFSKARKYLAKALELGINDKSKVFYAKGLSYQHQNNYDQALEEFNISLKYNPKNADTLFAVSTIQLLYGDFENGWQNYEYRWDAKNELSRPEYLLKWYTGKEDIKNKIILVQQEQGFGDNIQFVRYIYKLIQKGAVIYLALKKELHRLFSSIPNITLISDKDVLDNVDYFTSILDLPRVFYKEQDKFLYKDKYIDFLKEDIFKVKDKNKLNIGFSYRGSPLHKGDKKRNLALSDFKILFENSNIDFYSLQYENAFEVEEYMKEYKNIYDCREYINDFNDTANILSKLDLVITIDSSLIHLCGALGINSYLILGKNSEWRWLLNTNKSIWYNSIEIFREENSSFTDIFSQINDNLQNYKLSN